MLLSFASVITLGSTRYRQPQRAVSLSYLLLAALGSSVVVLEGGIKRGGKPVIRVGRRRRDSWSAREPRRARGRIRERQNEALQDLCTVLWDMKIVGTSMKGKGAKAVRGKRHTNNIMEIARGVVPRRYSKEALFPTRANVRLNPTCAAYVAP